jgi:hypothetical protein
VSEEPATLAEWRALLDRPLADIRQFIDESRIRDNAFYGQAGPLTLVRDRSFFPGNLYYDAGRLVLAYVERPATRAPDLSDEELLALVGDDAPKLRSRAGKFARTRVAAEKGLAVADDRGKVAYLELFPPTGFEDYRARLHQEPPAFIR